MTRITSLASSNHLIQLMLRSQERLQEGQVQVTSEKKSQTYAGIATASERLVTIENTRDLLDKYTQVNQLMDLRLSITESVTTGIEDAMREFRKDLATFRTTTMTEETDVRDVQKSAFSALKSIEAYLNTDVNGQFIFSGARANTQAVDFGLNTLADLQAKWNGANITYPTTRDTNIHHKMTTATGFPSDPTGAGFTSLTFNTAGTIATANVAAQVDTVTIAGTVEAGDTYSVTINGTPVTYTVTGLEANLAAVRVAFRAAINTAALGVTATDGAPAGEIILTSGTAGTPFTASTTAVNAGATADNTAAIVATTANANAFSNIPVGAKITIAGAGSALNDLEYTVTANSGGTLTVTPVPGANAVGDAGAGLVLVSDISYYSGDEVDQKHDLNKNRDFTLDLNGVDPAFEKTIRGLFIIAQGVYNTAGGLDQNVGRAADVDYLMDSAIDRNPGGTAPYGVELTSNITQIFLDNGYNRVLIDQINSTNTQLSAFFDTRTAEEENIDPLEVYTALLDEQNSLEASYQVFARIRQLSLTNFLT